MKKHANWITNFQVRNFLKLWIALNGNHRIKESWNQLIWKITFRSLRPTVNPSLSSPPLNYVPEYHIYVYFKYLQEGTLRHFPGQPVSMCDKPFRKEIFPNIQFNFIASKEAWPAVQRRWFCLSILLLCDSPLGTRSSSDVPNVGRTLTCWSKSRGGSPSWWKIWSTSPIRKGWQN